MMQIHTDAIIFGMSFISLVIGFVLGRWEKKDAYLQAYNRGKAVQAAIAAQTASNILESLGER
jgi:hypothetical protein